MARTKRIATSFVRQFKHLADLLSVTISRYSDELWFRDDLKRTPMPAWEAYHAISTVGARHMLSIPPEQLPHDPGQEPPPSREQVLALLADVRRHVLHRFSALTDEELVGNAKAPGTGVENLMYVFRHAHHHVGLLIQILREHGTQPPKWSTANML